MEVQQQEKRDLSYRDKVLVSSNKESMDVDSSEEEDDASDDDSMDEEDTV